MNSARDASVESLRAALDAMRLTREQLRSTEVAYRRAIKAIGNGRSISDTLEIIGAPSTRVGLNGALSGLEHSRHQARLSMLAGGIEEGLSMSELARKMGFSRQLAARYAKEVAGVPPAGRSPAGRSPTVSHTVGPEEVHGEDHDL